MRRSNATRTALRVLLGLALAAGATAMAAALAGCDRSKPAGVAGPSPTGTGTGQGGFGTGEPVEPVEPSPTTGAPVPTGYPKDARGYAQGAITAWANGWKDRLEQLSGPGVAPTFLNLGARPDSQWQYHRCEGAAGAQYCTFRDTTGNQLQLRITTQLLGKPHALAEVVYEKTEYPAGAEAYVGAFILAWANGNRQRMLALANNATLNAVGGGKAPASWTAQNNAPPPADGFTYVFETSSNGFSMTFKVRSSLLGKPHAIQCAAAGNSVC